jgi:Zn-finger protein
MIELIRLDNDSTDTVFCNPKYVPNIRDLEDSLSISTNGGVMKSHQKCDIPHIKDVWYNENAMTNIISMNDMKNKFCVMIDLKEELALLVHIPKKIVKFKQSSNGLYAKDPNDEKLFTVTNNPYQFRKERI